MVDLIGRITVIEFDGNRPAATTVYRKPLRRRRPSELTRPLERITRRLVRAHIIFGQEVLRRHDRANRRRRDGWLLEAPAIVAASGRKAYNEARKGVLFRVLPKI
jgi:hypothetical protein